MSLTGSIVIIVVMISRMVMRKLPKKYLYLLWGIVGFRLLCPIALESRFSIFNITPIRNSVENVRDIPLIQYGTGHAGDTVSAAVHHAGTAAGTAQAQMHINITPFILISVWAAIAVGIVCYIIYKYIVIKHDLNSTTEVKPGIYVGHQVDSPFVMGIIKPRIYMPAGLTESEMEYLTLHEKTHIRRGDVFFKALGILTVAVHWFNPLVWIAYAMFVRDMEMSCDEEVIARLGSDIKADYSMSLVSFARRSNNSKYIVVPVAFSRALFGRKDVKMRIKNVLGYHGTSKFISTMALVLVASISLVCLFNATSRADNTENDGEVTADAAGTAAETTAETSAETTVTDEAPSDDATVVVNNGDEGVEVNIECGEAENVPDYGQEPAGVPYSDNGVSGDKDAAAAADASWEENTDNILGKPLPVFKDVPVNTVLNLPKGTTVEEHPELDGYLIPGMPLESDAFCVYYSRSVSQNSYDGFINVLKTQYGFTQELNPGLPTAFTATNSDGITVTVEMLGSEYLRVSYYRLADGYNNFMRLG